MAQRRQVGGEGDAASSVGRRVGLDKLFDEINKMEKQEMESKIYSDYDERFQYVFGLGLFIMLLEFLVLERRNRWLSKINLFEKE